MLATADINNIFLPVIAHLPKSLVPTICLLQVRNKYYCTVKYILDKRLIKAKIMQNIPFTFYKAFSKTIRLRQVQIELLEMHVLGRSIRNGG